MSQGSGAGPLAGMSKTPPTTTFQQIIQQKKLKKIIRKKN